MIVYPGDKIDNYLVIGVKIVERQRYLGFTNDTIVTFLNLRTSFIWIADIAGDPESINYFHPITRKVTTGKIHRMT